MEDKNATIQEEPSKRGCKSFFFPLLVLLVRIWTCWLQFEESSRTMRWRLLAEAGSRTRWKEPEILMIIGSPVLALGDCLHLFERKINFFLVVVDRTILLPHSPQKGMFTS